MVFQNPYGSLNPRQKIGDVLGEPLAINTAMPASERRDRAHDDAQKGRPRSRALQPLSAHVLGRPAPAHRHRPGADAQSRACSCSTSRCRALDLSVQAQILNLLADLQDEFQLTYVFISHDLSVVRYIADDVMVMYLGEVVEQGTREAIFADPQHAYTRALFAATPRADVESIKARLAKRAADRLTTGPHRPLLST